MNLPTSYAIGIDLGGTKLNIGLVDSAGRIIENTTIPTPAQKDPNALAKDMITHISRLKGSDRPLAGVGIGLAGQIEERSSHIVFAPNLGWKHVDLKPILEQALGVPAVILNDVRAAAWGEWIYGAGRGSKDIVCLFLGTGIGSGVISKGRLLTGYSNTFGEVGHFPIQLNGPQCTCGSKGCFEALAGGWAIARTTRERVEADPSRSGLLLQLAGGDKRQLAASHVAKAAHQGDPLALDIVHEVAEALISGCTGIINLLNPQKLIIGGGLVQGYPEYIPLIRNGIQKMALSAPRERLEVVEAELLADAGIIGAAHYVMTQTHEGE